MSNCNPLHSGQKIEDGIHIPYAFEFSDAIERNDIGVYTVDDVGKFARQLDTNEIYMLTATVPIWTLIGPADLTGYIIYDELALIIDGYETIINHNSDKAQQLVWNQTVRASLDGYATTSTTNLLSNRVASEESKSVDQTQWNQTVRATLDGYATTSTTTVLSNRLALEESKSVDQTQWNQTVRSSLDGYISSIAFGTNYQSEVSLVRATTTSDQWQSKVTLTTPALTGTYRVGWHALLDTEGNNKEAQVRLYNSTDAAAVGGVQDNTTQHPSTHSADGFAEIVFTGVAKTFVVQWRAINSGWTVGVQDARIELWRVA